jgi:hypothetical protein
MISALAPYSNAAKHNTNLADMERKPPQPAAAVRRGIAPAPQTLQWSTIFLISPVKSGGGGGWRLAAGGRWEREFLFQSIYPGTLYNHVPALF